MIVEKIKDITAVILAGGKSSRMGEDKALIPFGGYESMAKLQYEKLCSLFEKVYISAKSNKFDFLDEKYLIQDISAISSPMVAIDSIFETLDAKKVFIITVDTPLVSKEIIIKLIDESKKDDKQIVFAQDSLQNNHVLCGVFDATLQTTIKEILKNDIHKINYLIKQSKAKSILFDNEQEFANINTKEEYLDLYQKK